MIDEKPPNLRVGYFLEGKTKGIKQERGLELLCLLDGGGPSRSTLFPLYWNVHDGLGFWPGWSGRPSHWWSHINGSGCCWWLLWIVHVVDSDKSSKVLDCQCRLPSILLLRVAFLRNQIVKPWYLACRLFGIDRAVLNIINLILLVIANLIFQLHVIHLPFLCGILFQQGNMKDVVNPPFLRQFELVSLFAYWM